MKSIKQFNDCTKTANVIVKLVERNVFYDNSSWDCTTCEDIQLTDEQFIPADSVFRFVGDFDMTETNVLEEIVSRGILASCGICNLRQLSSVWEARR